MESSGQDVERAADAPIALRARIVLPISGPPIDGGIVTIAAGKIVSVGSDGGGAAVKDLGDVALMPGLVNAHTHLEFSDLAAPLGTAGAILPDWIADVMSHRRQAADPARTIRRGLEECAAAGTTTLGEIATRDWRGDELPAVRPTAVVFHEAIGPTLPRAQAAAAAAEAFLAAPTTAAGVLPGLSPHAPYTVHPHLLAALVELSRAHHLPLAMHLAESREELELLTLGSGPFRDLLEDVGAWDASEGARLNCILDYLTELARAQRTLVIHGNYLDDEEIEFLAEHAGTMSVVYCPRTHAFFDHEPYPLRQMLDAGVAMALGTDSRASNPDLSMLAEMQCIAERHADVSPEEILRMGTLGGAAALGLESECGSIEVGKRADFVAVSVDPGLDDSLDGLVRGASKVVGTWIGGVELPVR